MARGALGADHYRACAARWYTPRIGDWGVLAKVLHSVAEQCYQHAGLYRLHQTSTMPMKIVALTRAFRLTRHWLTRRFGTICVSWLRASSCAGGGIASFFATVRRDTPRISMARRRDDRCAMH